MIPVLATVQVERPDQAPVRIWAPVILIWIVLLPMLVMLSPLLAVGALALRVNPLVAFGVLAEVVAAASGTIVEVEAPGASVNIRLI